MKKTLFLVLILTGAMTHAQETPTTLTCPREPQFEELIKDNANIWCSSGRFAEGANELFKLENNEYQTKELSSALRDNINNINSVITKSTQDIRQHTLCLELACEKIQDACASNKNYTAEKEQEAWCRTSATKLAQLNQIKSVQVTIQNSTRKNQSNYREKMRAIEVRASQYFIPLLDQFHNAFRRFTQKVPTFLSNPL